MTDTTASDAPRRVIPLNDGEPVRIVCADGDDGYRALLDDVTWNALDDAAIHLDWFNGTPGNDDEWLERIGDAQGLLLLWSVPDDVLRRSSRLKAVSWVGTGVETFVNVPLAATLGITVCNTPGYGSQAVAEHSLGLMLALARNTAGFDADMRQGRWPREDVRGIELSGKTVGVVGLGGIGTRVAELCGTLGMRVLAWTRRPDADRLARVGAELVTLPELFARSDVVTLHLAVTDTTMGIISEELLRLMKPTAFLINTARAELVDESALLDVLRAGRIAGAALDVFPVEPLPADNPWRELSNVLLTPHIGFRTPEASGRSVRIAVANLIAYFAGSPQNVVTVDG